MALEREKAGGEAIDAHGQIISEREISHSHVARSKLRYVVAIFLSTKPI